MTTSDRFGWEGHVIDGKYRVERAAGEGSFGVVYRAHHPGLDATVAVKCLKLPAELGGQDRDRFYQTFLDEGRLMHRLSRATTGVAQALDVGAAVSPRGIWTPYLVLEWLNGRSLADELSDRARRGLSPLSLPDAVALLEPAARALAVAHEQRVAHRDVKPDNIFLADVAGHRTAKLLDFGIAKVVSSTSTASSALSGGALSACTPLYAAPEQFHGRYGSTGPATDVFALALVLVEVISGRPALDGDDAVQLFVASADPRSRPTPRARGVATSDAVDGVFRTALAVDPRERYASASDFWAALHLALSAPVTPSPPAARAGDERSSYLSSVAPPAMTDPQPAGALHEPSAPRPDASSSLPRPPGDAAGRGRRTAIFVGAAIAASAAFAVVLGSTHANRHPAQGPIGAPSPDVPSAAANAVPPAAWSVVVETSSPTTRPSAAAPVAKHPAALGPGVAVAAGAVAAEANEGQNLWQPPFVVREAGADGALTFFEAAAACEAHGVMLCSEPQWRRACDERAIDAGRVSWVASVEPRQGPVARGGAAGGCSARAPRPASVGALVCCSRSVAVVRGDASQALVETSAARVLALETALNQHDVGAFRGQLADELTFYKSHGSRDHVASLLAGALRKTPDLWVLHATCELTTGPEGGLVTDCVKLAGQGAKLASVVSRYTFDAGGAVTSITDERVLQPFLPP